MITSRRSKTLKLISLRLLERGDHRLFGGCTF
jgi:hypothetical protein